MAAAKIRANYDQLKQVAGTFGKNADACKRTLQNIKGNKDTLSGGDWIGQGATAFYKEMDDSVLPTLQRLIHALDSAQTSISQISAVMQGAEQQAANVLKGGSPGGAAGGAAMAGAADAAGGAAVGGAAMAGAAGAAGGAAAGGAAMAGAAGAAGGAAAGGNGSAASQIQQLTNEATQAVSSLSNVPDDALKSAVNQLGGLASQFDNIVPPNFQAGGNGLGPLLSAIGSPNANQIAQQITQPFGGGGAPASGGGGSSGGGSSGGGSSGGGSSGGGGGGGSPSGGGVSGQAMQGFSDQALTALMNNPNLPPSDRMLAMAIETLRRDPNAFNGALKQFVDQALGQGATGPATNAVGGGISALAGAAGISAGGQPPDSTTNAINNLANQYNNIVQGGGASASGPARVSPVGPAASTAASAPPPPAGNAIMNLVQQFIQTVDAVIPKN